MLPQAETAF